MKISKLFQGKHGKKLTVAAAATVGLALCLLCSIGSNMLVNYAAGRMSVARMSAFSSLITLCSTFGGIVFLREPFSAASLLGTAMIIYGIWQVTRPDPEKKTE